jgi:hypothetical protein
MPRLERGFFGQDANSIAVARVRRNEHQEIAQLRGQRGADQGAQAIGVREAAALQVAGLAEFTVQRGERLQEAPAQPARVDIRAATPVVAGALRQLPRGAPALGERRRGRSASHAAVSRARAGRLVRGAVRELPRRVRLSQAGAAPAALRGAVVRASGHQYPARVVPEPCTQRVLVSELACGQSFDDFVRSASAEARQRSGLQLWQFSLESTSGTGSSTPIRAPATICFTGSASWRWTLVA